MSERVRVLRVIEYVGTREEVEEQLRSSSMPNNGEKNFIGSLVVKSAIIGDFPEILESKNDMLEFKKDHERRYAELLNIHESMLNGISEKKVKIIIEALIRIELTKTEYTLYPNGQINLTNTINGQITFYATTGRFSGSMIDSACGIDKLISILTV